MDLTQNLNNSFEYAKKIFSDFGRLVILIILDLIPIVNLIVIGYAARVLKESPGADAPPKLEDYGGLFVQGVKVFFAALIYMIIPLILFTFGGASIVGGMVPGFGSDFRMSGFSPAQFSMLSGIGVLLMVVGAIVAFFMLIILAAGIADMIKANSFGKAFALGEIFRLIGKIGWGKYLVWVVLVAIIAGLVGGVVGSIPYVGWLIQAIIAPALSVFFFRSMGLLYSEGSP